MSTPTTYEQFVAQIADSTILSADEIAAAIGTVPKDRRPKDGEQLARELVRLNKLTVFQAQQLYAGKGKDLVRGNYVIVDKLGKGGMGVVYKAEHKRMRRQVALKVLSPQATKSPEAVKRFHREVEAAAKLNHPNIVAAYDADEFNGTHFLVMEYVEGDDLSNVVKKQGPLPVDKAVNFILQAARGLEFAHQRGVIHRDIKPANMLLDGEGNVKILDMGLARFESDIANEAELTSTGQVMGTVDYMAPEQALSTKQADQRSDIYSLGMSLWWLLTGHAAYGGDSLMARMLAHREQPIPSLCASRKDAPKQLDAVFAKMIAKNAKDRYQSMSEVVAALETCRPGSVERTQPQVQRDEDKYLGAVLREQSRPSQMKLPVAQPLTPQKPAKSIVGPKPPAASAAGSAPAMAAPPPPRSKTNVLSVEETMNTGTPSGSTDSQLNRLFNVASPAPLPAGVAKKKAAPWWQDQRVLLLGGIGAAVVAGVLLLAIAGIAFFLTSGDDDVADGAGTTHNVDGAQGSNTTTTDSGSPPPILPPVASSSIVVLDHLGVSQTQASLWPSIDGLRLYYEAPNPTDPRRFGVWMVSRLQVDAPFTSPVFLVDMRHPCLTADELEMVGIGHGVPAPLLRTRRVSRDGTFSTPEEMFPRSADVVLQHNVKSPYIARDGLRLFWQRNPGSGIEFATLRRVSRDARWNVPPRAVRLFSEDVRGKAPTWPWASDDDKFVIFCHGGDRVAEIWTAERDAVRDDFKNFRPVLVDGSPLIGRSPRWCEATGELFFSQPTGNDQWQLAVLKNFWPRGKPTSAAGGSGQWIDVIPLIDVARDCSAVGDPKNRWSKENGELLHHRAPQEGHFMLPVSFSTPNAELELDYTLVDGDSNIPFSGGFNINWPSRMEDGRLLVGVNKLGRAHLGAREEITLGRMSHQVGRRYKLNVRSYSRDGQDHLEMDLDGQRVGSWSGKRSAISTASKATLENMQRFSFWIFGNSAWRFHSIRARSLDGVDAVVTPLVPDGFAALFNGRDLSGWEVMQTSGNGANDQSIHRVGFGGWEVADGILRCTTSIPGWLKTTREFDNFVLQLEYRLPLSSSNSGIYIRSPATGHLSNGGMEVQVMEGQGTTGQRTGDIMRAAQAVGKLPYAAAAAGNPPRADGRWNQLEISCNGELVQVKLNGEVITATDMSMNDALRNRPRRGFIGLANWMGQAQGVEFRNIWIKELPATASTTAGPGWQPLFPGDDISAWKGKSGMWSMKGGELTGTPSAPPSYSFLFSPKLYADFELQFQARLRNDQDNSGVQIRSEIFDAATWSARGPQVEVGGAGTWGGLYGEQLQIQGGWLIPSTGSPSIKRDDFNDYVIRCLGKRVTISVNGVTTVDQEVPSMADEGLIAFQVHRRNTGDVTFRNLQIRELDETVPPAEPETAGVATFNGHKYKFFPEVLSWKEARARCVALGGDLVVIDSLAENTFVGDLVTKAGALDCWIGATDEAEEKQWVAPSGQRLSFLYWAKGQPNNKGAGEHFALITNRSFGGQPYNWQWCDQPDVAQAVHQPGYMCEWTSSSSATTTDGGGWIDLFNGRDLTGWKEIGTTKGWRVADGELIADGKATSARQAGWLMTDRDFADFELQLEFSIDQRTDTGVAFRCDPALTTGNSQAEIQIVDQADADFIATFDRLPFARTGSLAGLAADRTLPTVERNQWHTLKVVAKERRVQATVNGVVTFDTDLDKHARVQPSRAGVTRAAGPIALQRLLGSVRYRKIRIRDLGGASAATPAPHGWVELFNGIDLDNWTKTDGTPAHWRVFDKSMEIVKGGSIRTKAEYGPDFELALEFWLPSQPQLRGQARANSGVYLIGRHEVQICDAFNNDVPNKTQTCGAIYNLIAPEVDAIAPPETWQSFAIDYRAPRWLANGALAAEGRVAIFHNGKRIITDGKLSAHNAGALLTTAGSRGPIVLQDHGNPVRFRNIRIRERAP